MASRITRQRWKLIGGCAGAGMVMFIALAFLRGPGSPAGMAVAGLGGVVLGAVAAPLLEPKLFRAPVLWQAGAGMIGAGLVALAMGADPGVIFAAAMTGGILGALARYWLWHV